jgi:glutamyl/glutaminyl-tRNA synthetase
MALLKTRFNPTPNGPLHLGHAYLLKVLRDSADQLLVRQDRQRYWTWLNGKAKEDEFIAGMHADIEWLGIKVDAWTDCLQYKPQVEDLLTNQFHYQPDPEPFVHDEIPEVIGLDQAWYSYTDYLTCEKVILDFLEGINWIVRGWDLLVECNHYTFYTHKFGLPRVKQTFTPKLFWKEDVVSKTLGTFKIKDFREKGIQPDEILDRLAQDCLVDPSTAWTTDNIRTPWPVLGDWAYDLLK